MNEWIILILAFRCWKITRFAIMYVFTADIARLDRDPSEPALYVGMKNCNKKRNIQSFEIHRFVQIIDSYRFNTINWKKILVRDLFYNEMVLQLSMIIRHSIDFKDGTQKANIIFFCKVWIFFSASYSSPLYDQGERSKISKESEYSWSPML